VRLSRTYIIVVPFLLLIANCFGQLENGLLLHYELDGDYTDSSPNGYDGTPIDITFIDDQFGIPSSAVLLNGVTSRVDFPNIPELEPDFPMSFAVKTRFDLINGQQIVFATDFSGSTHSGAWLQLSSSRDIAVSYGNAQGGFTGSTRHGKVAPLPIDAGTWYNVVIIIRGFQDIDIYIDCELIEGSYNGSATSIGYTNGVGNLGRKSANPIAVLPPYFFEGAIDDFWYWDRELTEEEVLGLCEIEEPCLGSLSVPDISGCVNEPIEFLLDLEDENSDILTYFWEFEDGASSNSSNLTLTYPNEITQDFTLIITTEDDCVYTTAGTMTVEFPPAPFMQNEFNICSSDEIDLDFSDLPFDVFNSEGEAVVAALISTGGTYIFTGQNACSSFEEVVLVNETVIDPPSFGDFEFLCQGLDTLAIGFNSSAYDYLWDSGSQEPSILVFESGQNEVLVTDTAGICSESFIFQVNSFPFAPSEIFEFPAVEICLEGQTNINFPPQFGPYTFSDTSAGLTYTATETESLSFTYSDGCYTYQDTLFISVESCLCPAWVPNVFTPNEDGLNDLFKPVLDCEVYAYQMLVFNRWGREIFQSNDINTAWRGESPNSDFYASTGIYVYLIVFSQELDGLRVPTELTGTVTLLR